MAPPVRWIWAFARVHLRRLHHSLQANNPPASCMSVERARNSTSRRSAAGLNRSFEGKLKWLKGRRAQPQVRKLTQDEIRRGIDRLNLRINDVREFDPKSVKQRWSPEVKALLAQALPAMGEAVSTIGPFKLKVSHEPFRRPIEALDPRR